MIDHVWSVLCAHVLIDADTNSATLYNTIEEVTVLEAPQPGARLGLSFEVASLWIRTDPLVSANGSARLTVSPPSGEARVAGEVTIDTTAAERSRTKFVFGSFSPSESGRYVFTLDYRLDGEAEWRTAARLPLTVNLPAAWGESA